jgi:hypothetical protein
MALWVLKLFPVCRTGWVAIANNSKILRLPALLGLSYLIPQMPPLRIWTNDINDPFKPSDSPKSDGFDKRNIRRLTARLPCPFRYFSNTRRMPSSV